MTRDFRWLSRATVPIALVVVGLLVSFPGPVRGQGSSRSVFGQITYVAADAVEVSGRRGVLTSESSVVSDGRSVAPGSLHPGMPAEMEVDPVGRILELRVTGVVE